MTLLQRFRIFFRERFPIGLNCSLSIGLTLTSLWVLEFSHIKSPYIVQSTSWGHLLFLFVVFFLFLGQLRFMDELKDYEKDKIVHPTRPLPRGLISQKEIGSLIKLVQVLLYGLSILAFFVFQQFSAWSLFIGVTWLLLMYFEFFTGGWLKKFPFLYAISHQVVILPMGFFAMSGVHAHAGLTLEVFSMSCVLLSAFFIYEISRKLDPNANPLLGTYLIVSGKAKTISAIILLTILGGFSLVRLGSFPFELGFLIFLGISHGLILVKPHRYKIVEAIVVTFLLIAIWFIPVRKLISMVF